MECAFYENSSVIVAIELQKFNKSLLTNKKIVGEKVCSSNIMVLLSYWDEFKLSSSKII